MHRLACPGWLTRSSLCSCGFRIPPTLTMALHFACKSRAVPCESLAFMRVFDDYAREEWPPGGIQAPCKSTRFGGRGKHRSLHRVARIARFAHTLVSGILAGAGLGTRLAFRGLVVAIGMEQRSHPVATPASKVAARLANHSSERTLAQAIASSLPELNGAPLASIHGSGGSTRGDRVRSETRREGVVRPQRTRRALG
jgi:hypothetical protein